MRNLLEICVCFTNHAQRLPTKLDKCGYFGSGKFGFGQGKVREMSGNFDSTICGNPVCFMYGLSIYKIIRICLRAYFFHNLIRKFLAFDKRIKLHVVLNMELKLL